MDATTLCGLTIGQLGELLRSRDLSPVEATEAALERTERLDGNYNAFIEIWREEASGNYRGPLHGVPIALA